MVLEDDASCDEETQGLQFELVPRVVQTSY